jgi:hypothetical protein
VLGALFVASALFSTETRVPAQFTETVTFAAAGDHGSTDATTASLSALASSGATFYLALGDLSYGSTGAEQSWCDLVTSRVGSSYPFELVSGNHDDDGSNGFIDSFAACLPDRMGAQGRYGAEYYFDYGTLLRVIMIAPDLTIGGESYQYVRGTSHYAWLEQAIDGARTAGIRWVIVGMHKVCISVGSKSCEIGADLMDLLIAKRVDLVLQGHDHDYQRSKQLTCAFEGSVVSACIADDGSDDTYIKGAGTVFVIAGAFGRSLYSIDTADPEVGYFARWMGSNANPTYGFVKYTVTPSQISAQYVGTSGGTFTDSFRIVSPSLARFEETAATLAPEGAWAGITGADVGVTLSGDRAVYEGAAGATATFTFTGTEVSWIGFPCEVCGIARVHLDGALVGTVDTFAATRPPASGVMFTARGLAAASHTLVIEVTGTANPSSGGVYIVVDAFAVTGGDTVPSDSTPPTVAITAPSDGATVSGTIIVSATASDDVGVASVQFLLDGAPLAEADTTAPYEVAWDTRTVPDGIRTLTARARDAAGNMTVAAPMTVTVENGPLETVTRFEETAATLAPEGAWAGITGAGAGVTLSGDRAVYAGAAGATATFTFTGTEVSWIGFPCEVCGIARIHLDGALVGTVDTFAATRPPASGVMFTARGLAAASHTLAIDVTGTANPSSGWVYVVVDAFAVTP